jgi:hypothetical protein
MRGSKKGRSARRHVTARPDIPLMPSRNITQPADMHTKVTSQSIGLSRPPFDWKPPGPCWTGRADRLHISQLTTLPQSLKGSEFCSGDNTYSGSLSGATSEIDWYP